MQAYFEKKFILLDPRQASKKMPAGKYLSILTKPAYWSFRREEAVFLTQQEIDMLKGVWSYIGGCTQIAISCTEENAL